MCRVSASDMYIHIPELIGTIFFLFFFLTLVFLCECLSLVEKDIFISLGQILLSFFQFCFVLGENSKSLPI